MSKEIDIYFSPKYGEIYEKNGEGKLEQFHMESINGHVSYTFLKRKINIKLDKEYYDITTPYGYGGPLFEVYNGKVLKDLVIDFKDRFESYCKKNNIVSEFIRFHPVICNHEEMNIYMEVSNIRNTICLDLNSEEEIWNNIHSKCRNMIRKAEKNNVLIEVGNSKNDLEVFYRLYIDTMKKNNALNYYLFDYKFFQNTIEMLKDNVVIFKAIYNNNIISAALIMCCGDYIHYHFSGSDTDYKSLGANNLLIYRAAIWGYNRRCKHFHLGGGYSGNKDNLFKFKKSFFKGNLRDFYIGKKIHNIEIYNKLADMIEENKLINKSYFPIYRG